MSASNTLCLPLYVSLLLQNSLVVALGYGPWQRKTVLEFLDCLFSCSAVFHLLFHILVAGISARIVTPMKKDISFNVLANVNKECASIVYTFPMSVHLTVCMSPCSDV